VTGKTTLERVQPPTRQSHRGWRIAGVKPAKLQPQSHGMLWLDTRLTPGLKELLETLMTKIPDHDKCIA
jgi:hypothetical protein